MKYALVTGGSRGIGQAICLQLAAQGYHVLINYVQNETAAQQTAQQIENQGGAATCLQFDVANAHQVQETLLPWIDQHPEHPIEILVNNAGLRRDALFIWMEPTDWHSVLQVHLDGFYHVTRPLLLPMMRHRYGRIINVVSLSGMQGRAGQVNYSAAKAALVGATKALAQEVGRSQITVNAVAPGFIQTDMTKDLDEKEHRAQIPLRRFGQPEEVAALVGFLASPQAGYITGEVIAINGGLYT